MMTHKLYVRRIGMLLRALVAVVSLIISSAWIHAEPPTESGIAWDVRGDWHLNHAQRSLRKGDAVPPGALLSADTTVSGSIFVLLPDGQRLLFDCHDAHTCAQGFRIPALIAKPDDDALDLFEGVRRAMDHPGSELITPTPPRSATTTEIEAVVRVQSDGALLLRQPLVTLPPGQYRMTVQSADQAQPSERSLTWSGPRDETHLALPHAGIYRMRLFGTLGGERMRVVILAVTAEAFPAAQKGFEEATKTLHEWNETFPGWPIHEWRQLYLQSLSDPRNEKDPQQ
jgi:hypothetical protein